MYEYLGATDDELGCRVEPQAGASVQCSLLLLSCLALGLPTAYGSMMTTADDQNAWTVLEVDAGHSF